MVIVILGILSAFALPRFADLSGEAELAAAEGALGSAKSASAITHAAFLATNANPVDLEGANIGIANGYPTGTLDADRTDNAGGDICTAAQLADDFTCAQDSAGVISVSNGACSFTYTQATATAAPQFSTVTCT